MLCSSHLYGSCNIHTLSTGFNSFSQARLSFATKVILTFRLDPLILIILCSFSPFSGVWSCIHLSLSFLLSLPLPLSPLYSTLFSLPSPHISLQLPLSTFSLSNHTNPATAALSTSQRTTLSPPVSTPLHHPLLSSFPTLSSSPGSPPPSHVSLRPNLPFFSVFHPLLSPLLPPLLLPLPPLIPVPWPSQSLPSPLLSPAFFILPSSSLSSLPLFPPHTDAASSTKLYYHFQCRLSKMSQLCRYLQPNSFIFYLSLCMLLPIDCVWGTQSTVSNDWSIDS